jgi:hypothetical protein
MMSLSLVSLGAFNFNAPLQLNNAIRSPSASVLMSADLQPEVAEPEVAAPPAPAPVILKVGNKVLAGDWGFDPLQLGDTEKLAFYREAEVKHARLAMLAAAGWPLAEKLNGPLSSMLGVDSILQGGMAPSILNGGLGGVSPIYWVLVLGLATFVESKTLDMQLNIGKRPEGYLPGMIGFDPLGMDSDSMRNAEILNGRIAMIAITLFALEEAIFKTPVVKETALFFQPVWTLF